MTQTQNQIDEEFEEYLANLRNEEGDTFDLDLARYILRQVRELGAGFSVDVDEAYETVNISDDDNFQDAIFMQGAEAADFIAEAESLYEEAGHVSIDEAYQYLALPYVENNWN